MITEYHSRSAATQVSAMTWRIYLITRCSDGRGYVGLTAQSVPARFAGHCADAKRDGGSRGGADTVTAALRAAMQAGQNPRTAFRLQELGEYKTPDAARHAEALSIRTLGTARPNGFNVMPGGASLGAIANAKQVALDHPLKGHILFPTISEALAFRNDELRSQSKRPLVPGAVYARLHAGWNVCEALGYTERLDGRARVGRPIRVRSRVVSRASAAQQLGLSRAAMRSRAHRARRSGMPGISLAVDRRGPYSRRADSVAVSLPHPSDPNAPALNSVAFAAVSGIPKATILDRLMQLRIAGRDPAHMTRPDLLKALMETADRRIKITLTLPNGDQVCGGIRELIRLVLANAELSNARVEMLGASAIRARLRRLANWPSAADLTPQDLMWAFGFSGIQPDDVRPTSQSSACKPRVLKRGS